ncbi:hypothetical protein EDF69_001801 [Sphingomonas sp. JUb134]|nr:hypothetical protein [Sphingomonas sp. JUb134]
MTTPLGCSPSSTATGLLLEALGASDTYDYVPVRGLPTPALHVPERDALIAVTTAAPPMFAGSLEAIAGEHRLDVVLLRLGDAGRGVIAADFALGSLPCAVWVERNFALYRDASGLWLVPERAGPSVSITPTGFCLEMVPPFSTLTERERGVRRAACDMARILQPVEVR